MRRTLTVTVESSISKNLKELSEITRIPASKLFDEAVEDLLNKHRFKKLCNKKGD